MVAYGSSRSCTRMHAITHDDFPIDTHQINSLRMNAGFFKRVHIQNPLFIKNDDIRVHSLQETVRNVALPGFIILLQHRW